MDRINSLIVKLQTRREDGQAMVEYDLIIALVAVVGAVTLGTVGDNLALLFTDIATQLGGA